MTNNNNNNNFKCKIVERLLHAHPSVFVHFDPRTPTTVVPLRLALRAHLVFQVGYDMPVPIPDLRTAPEGIYGTLSFGGKPFACFVPWSAVCAVVGEGEGSETVFSPPSMDAMIEAGLVPGVTSITMERHMRKGESKPQVFHKKTTAPAVRPPFLHVVK